MSFLDNASNQDLHKHPPANGHLKKCGQIMLPSGWSLECSVCLRKTKIAGPTGVWSTALKMLKDAEKRNLSNHGITSMWVWNVGVGWGFFFFFWKGGNKK